MYRRFLLELAVVAALLPPALVWLAGRPGLIDADLALYHHLLAWHPPAPSEDILIIGIDRRSLRELGPWPWPRATHAALLEQLAGHAPRAVLFDVFFDRASAAPAGDARLAAAMRLLPVYLPLRYTGPPGPGDDPSGFAAPIPILRHSARGVGHVDVTSDDDNFVRTLFRYEGPGDAGDRPENRALQPYVGLQLVSGAPVPPGTGPVLQRRDGWRTQSGFGMAVAGPVGTYRTVPYLSVLRGEVPDELLRGRDLLIGAVSDADLGDQFAVAGLGAGQLLPGVEVHANVIDALRHDRTVWSLPPAALWAWTLLPVWLALGLFLRWGRWALAGAVGLAAACLALSVTLFVSAQVWLPPAAPLLGVALTYVLWSWRRLEALFVFFNQRIAALNAIPAGEFELALTPAPTTLDALEHQTHALDRAIERMNGLQLFLRHGLERELTTERKAQQERVQWLRFLSHDLRSPQVSILSLLDLQAGGAAGMNAELMASGVRREAERTLALAEGFMDLTEAESGEYRFDEVLAGAVLLDAIDRAWPYAQAQGVTLVPRLGEHEGGVRADGAMLTRAIVNLLNNAIRHTPREGSIHVCLEATDAWVLLSVRDEGQGMGAAQLGRVLQRGDAGAREHARAEPAAALAGAVAAMGAAEPRSASARSRGIGLSVVHAVIAKHGGWIDAWSAPDEGTTIVIGLPPLA